MGMKKSAIVSSIATIALCAGVITGSTWATFTSETSTSIVVSSANVTVVADIIESSKNLLNEDPNKPGFFKNGGSATITGNTLELENITPGDGVSFSIELANSSNVKVNYRVVVKSVEGGDDDFANALEVKAKYGGKEAIMGTQGGEYLAIDPPQNAGDFTKANIEVEVKFKDNLDTDPNDNNDPYEALQGKEATVQVIVEAVQANGAT